MGKEEEMLVGKKIHAEILRNADHICLLEVSNRFFKMIIYPKVDLGTRLR